MSLHSLYYNLSHPSALSSVAKLKIASKKMHSGGNKIKGGNIESKKAIDKWLHKQNTYTLHAPARKNFPRRPTYANNIDHIWQADLADMSRVKQFNKPYTFILTCIDIFSKYAWAIPCANKSAKSITDAFKIILRDGRSPKKIQTDKGTEFKNRQFQKLLKEYNIHFYTSHDDEKKAAVVERFNRTLKGKIYKHFTSQNAKRYIKALKPIVKGYNNSVHRTIGMTPFQASKLSSPSNIARLYQKIYGRKEDGIVSRQKFNVNDLVRISKYAHPFSRGFHPNYTFEVFRIRAIYRGKPILYSIEDKDGELIKGRFYAQQLIPFTGKTISKLLKRRKRGGKTQYLVQYNFHPSEWISSSLYKRMTSAS